MKLFFLTDCMSINEEVPEALRYPYLVKQHLSDAQIQIIGLGGMTTLEVLEHVKTVLDYHPDVVVYAFGINDALPRGLIREQRARLIRFTYKIKMNKVLRLAYRTYFLNPLEYILQFVARPKHYFSPEQMIANMDGCIRNFKEHEIPIIIINLNPVQNYRFVRSNLHIQHYNDAIHVYCDKEEIPYVDAFSIFYRIGLQKALASDRFHYSEEAHRAVADALIPIIQMIKEQKI